MKRWLSIQVPLAITIVLGLILLVVVWSNHDRLTQLRKSQQGLILQADSLESSNTSSRKRSRNRASDVKRIARDFIAIGIEFKACYNDDLFSQLDDSSRERFIAQINRVLSLNQKGLEQLLELVIAEPDLDQNVRSHLLNFTLKRWAELNPAKALDFLTRSTELSTQLGRSRRSLLTLMVTSWAMEAPDDIIAWLDKDHEQVAPKNRSSVLYHLSRAIVIERPLETFELINKHSEKPHSYFPVIFKNNKLTLAERTEILHRVRKASTELEGSEAQEKFLTRNLKALVLGQKNHQGDFQDAIDMIKTSALQIDDIEFIWNPAINDLGYYIKEEQTGDWIKWLHDSVPEEKSARRIKQLLERWNRRAPDAAAEFARKNGF